MRRTISIVLASALVTGLIVGAAYMVVSSSRPETSRITVIEGLTVAETIESLAEQTEFEVGDYREALLGGTVRSELLPVAADDPRNWEGLLFPDTYEITDVDEPADILQLLAHTAEARVDSVDWGRLEARGLTPYHGIVIASLIEREAALDEERPRISSVIHNRLEMGMKLQIDATVVYALGGHPAGGITYDDLEVASPYNTYLVDGLPPTPIAGVRLASLQAAADPDDTDYLFYVLADADGSHAFSATYEEFLENKERSQEKGLIP